MNSSIESSHWEILENEIFALVVKNLKKYIDKSWFFNNIASWILVTLQEGTPSSAWRSHNSANKLLNALESALFFNHMVLPKYSCFAVFVVLFCLRFSSLLFKRFFLKKLLAVLRLVVRTCFFKFKLRHAILSRTVFRNTWKLILKQPARNLSRYVDIHMSRCISTITQL